MINTTNKKSKGLNTPYNPPKDPSGDSLITDLILRALASDYGVNHVHIHHERERVWKLVPAYDEYGKVYANHLGKTLYYHQQQFKGTGGRTYASVLLSNGKRFDAVAVTNNQSKFVKKVGYNESVRKLWVALLESEKTPTDPPVCNNFNGMAMTSSDFAEKQVRNFRK